MKAAVATFAAASACWGQCMLEIPPDEDGRWYANGVGASGDYIAIGNPRPYVSDSSVLIYRETGGTWELTQEVKPTDPEVRRGFGWSCDLDGARLVVGAPADGELGSDVGAAYVFELRGSTWEQTARLLPPSPYERHRFGWLTAIAGDLIVANTDIFRFDGHAWAFEQRLLPPWSTDAVATDGQRIVIGDEDLAHEAGLHRTHISLIERGQRSARLETIEQLAQALGVQPADLMPKIRLR